MPQMTITGIKDNVHALLVNTDKFKTVLAAPPSKGDDFEGYPSASHYYSSAESSFATVTQNRRVIEYVVELYLVTNSETPNDTELAEAYALTDDIMQMFDESIDLSSTELGLSPACQIQRPTPSDLVPYVTKDGQGLIMTIRLFCEGDTRFRNT